MANQRRNRTSHRQNQEQDDMTTPVTNPFEAPQPETDDAPVFNQTIEATQAEPEQAPEATAPAEVAEVDTPEALDDETEEVAAGTAAPSTEEKPAAEKKPARPAVPEGYITPVEFAKKLTAHLAEKQAKNKNGFIGRSEDGATVNLAINPIPPQYIYSMINNGRKPNAKNPLPTYSEGGRENLLKLEEALAWWDAKDARVAASHAAQAEKKAKQAAKAQTSEQAATETGEVATGPVEEAE